MARLLRLNPRDGIHHVNNHVVGDELLFHDDQDRRVILRLIEEARAAYRVVILGYCLMGNHFHLVVLCPQANLDRFMRHFQSRYARYYNRRSGRRGTLFQDRFHSNLVTTDGQLQFTLRYVDRNPLELGIDISSYPWGSYGVYSGSRSGCDELVTFDQRWVLAFAGSHAGYRRFVEQDASHDPFLRIHGTRQIVAEEVEDGRQMKALIETVTAMSGEPAAAIKTSRRGSTNDARLVAFLVAAGSDTPREEIMKELGCKAKSTYVSTVQRAQRRRSESAEFAALADAIASRWNPTLRNAA